MDEDDEVDGNDLCTSDGSCGWGGGGGGDDDDVDDDNGDDDDDDDGEYLPQ